MANSINIAMVRDAGYFNLNGPQFVVLGPTPDSGVELMICDDFIDASSMTVSPGPEGQQAQIAVTEPHFERVVYGRIKLPLAQAKAFATLLARQLDDIEAAIKKATTGQASAE